MYILKNAFISIKRNIGRNVLIGIIILVVSCAASVTLAIRNSANSIICSRQEVLWEGEISSGEIPLSDSINKFKNLKAYIRFYGNNIKDLNFVGTFAYIKEFNLADNLSETLKVNFVEMLLTLNNETNTITITHNNQVEILNGVNTSVPSVGSIYKIIGERVYF